MLPPARARAQALAKALRASLTDFATKIGAVVRGVATTDVFVKARRRGWARRLPPGHYIAYRTLSRPALTRRARRSAGRPWAMRRA